MFVQHVNEVKLWKKDHTPSFPRNKCELPVGTAINQTCNHKIILDQMALFFPAKINDRCSFLNSSKLDNNCTSRFKHFFDFITCLILSKWQALSVLQPCYDQHSYMSYFIYHNLTFLTKKAQKERNKTEDATYLVFCIERCSFTQHLHVGMDIKVQLNRSDEYKWRDVRCANYHQYNPTITATSSISLKLQV